MKKIILTCGLVLFAIIVKAQWTDNGTNLTTTDNVGIGLSNPASNLHIYTTNPGDNSLKSASILSHHNLSSNNDSGIALEFGRNENGNGHQPMAKIGYVQMNGGSWKGDLVFHTRTNVSTINEKMRILSNGNVGIGLSNPASNLHVYTTNPGDNSLKSVSTLSHYNLSSNNNSGIAIEFGRNENGNGHQPMAKIGYVQMNGGSWKGDLVFHTRTNSSTVSEKMRILSNGNVGIGTTSTGSHRLAVEGSIGAREIKVEATGWSDFVFENDYQLRTLEEVEEHINEKGHLPEIPSETEVTENGINLGEMNAKLLQKIEELTLYLIEQNKKIEELTEKVQSLENE